MEGSEKAWARYDGADPNLVPVAPEAEAEGGEVPRLHSPSSTQQMLVRKKPGAAGSGDGGVERPLPPGMRRDMAGGYWKTDARGT